MSPPIRSCDQPKKSMENVEVPWADLPEELVDSISNHMSSNIDLIHIRSICMPWRSAVAAKKLFFQHKLPRLKNKYKSFLYRTTYFRVTLPSSSLHKGWLVTTVQSAKSCLVSPLSRELISPHNKTLDLLKFRVSEIRRSYEIYIYSGIDFMPKERHKLSSRVVLVDNLVLAVDYKNQVWCCKNGEESWTRIKSQVVETEFSDIIVHKGQVYVLDLQGAIWWIRLSDLSLVQFTPYSTLMAYYHDAIYDSKYMRLVEYCGDLCIVDRVSRKYSVERPDDISNDGFKVYKMDQDFATWVEVRSLGDKALIMDVDGCFMVLASEYYGCLQDAIYFTESNGDVKVFKLYDGSIISRNSGSSCFKMFSLPFLYYNQADWEYIYQNSVIIENETEVR